MQFADLPNGGHNLRLYTYDPVGSQYGPPNIASCPGIYIYNTGHFDIALGVPCSQSDPQGFCTWDAMSAYAGSRGESLVMVARSDLMTLCAYRAPVQITVGPPVLQRSGASPTGTTPYSGGITGATISVSGGGAGPSGGISTPGYVPSPGTPIEAGGLPGGVGTSGAALNPPLTQIYRFILYDPSSDPAHPYATGASYPGCSAVNTVNCLPKSFSTQTDAIQYALDHGEIPYKVLNANEPWGIINGTIGIDPSRILSGGSLSLTSIALILGGLWFLSGR